MAAFSPYTQRPAVHLPIMDAVRLLLATPTAADNARTALDMARDDGDVQAVLADMGVRHLDGDCAKEVLLARL